MVIKVMAQHGFHEPALANRLTNETILRAKQEQVLWLPDDEAILRLTPKAFSGLCASLNAEFRAIEFAKTTSWQDIDGQKQGNDFRNRVRAVQSDKELRRARWKYNELLNNGKHTLLATYEQEREALLAEIEKLQEENKAAQAVATELPISAEPPSEPSSLTAFAGVLDERLTLLQRTNDNALVAQMDSEITFLRSVVERLMAK